MQTHQMKLDTAPFAMIRSGKKTIELRLYDGKRRRIRPGDRIVFTCRGSGETLTARVRGLHIFASFADLYRSLPLGSCGYTGETLPGAGPADMERYYSPEDQKRYGVLGIELEVIPGT